MANSDANTAGAISSTSLANFSRYIPAIEVMKLSGAAGSAYTRVAGHETHCCAEGDMLNVPASAG